MSLELLRPRVPPFCEAFAHICFALCVPTFIFSHMGFGRPSHVNLCRYTDVKEFMCMCACMYINFFCTRLTALGQVRAPKTAANCNMYPLFQEASQESAATG